MKVITKILALTLAMILAALCLFSCSPKVDEEGDVLVVIEFEDGTAKEYELLLEKVENKDEGAAGILEYLKNREEDPLSLNMSDSTYGKYIHGIGGIEEDTAANKYVMVYTSVEKDFGTWEGVGELTYKGRTLKNAGVGVSEMTVESGMIILFRLEVSAW